MIATPAKLTVLRTLGFTATCAIIVANMVGQGVFLKARVMLCNVEWPLTMLAAWVVAGLLALCGSLTLAELSAALPESGGIYAFLRRAYGRAVAFAYGWTSLFIGGPASSAALAAGAAIFFNVLSGGALDRLPSLELYGPRFSVTGLQSAAIVLIAVVTAINCAPALVNGRIATVFAVLKIAMLVAITVAGFAAGHGSAAMFTADAAAGSCSGVAPAARFGVAGFAAALIGALYAYQGWQSVTLVAGEIRNPGRTFPLALSVAVGVVITGYVLSNTAFVYVLGPLAIANLAPGVSVGIRVVETLLGPVWRSVAAALLFASVAATLHVTILTVSRVSYAFGEDMPALGALARLSPRARVPVNALLANGVIAAVLVLSGSFDTLSDYLVFNSWIFFVATAGALFVLRRREPQLVRPYRISGYPFVPAVVIVAGGWLLVQTFVSSPRDSLIGLAIVAASFPVYVAQQRWLRK